MTYRYRLFWQLKLEDGVPCGDVAESGHGRYIIDGRKSGGLFELSLNGRRLGLFGTINDARRRADEVERDGALGRPV
jgi:hypothetical protein